MQYGVTAQKKESDLLESVQIEAGQLGDSVMGRGKVFHSLIVKGIKLL
jgi:hypothetical protein